MNTKEATIISYALQYLNSNWDDFIEESLDGIAIDKDVQFLQKKYEGLSQEYKGKDRVCCNRTAC